MPPVPALPPAHPRRPPPPPGRPLADATPTTAPRPRTIPRHSPRHSRPDDGLAPDTVDAHGPVGRFGHAWMRRKRSSHFADTTTTTTTTAPAPTTTASRPASTMTTPPSSGSGGGAAATTLLEQAAALLGSVASYMRLPALASTSFAAVVTSLLYFKQKSLIYPSNIPANARQEIPSPAQFGLTDFEELVIPTEDGEKLAAFYIRGPRPRPGTGTGGGGGSQRSRHARTTVLMFHGNAGNIGHRLPIARMLRHLVGCNIFMLEYRGYGRSTGEPGESGLVLDAQTALDYLRRRAETRAHKFVVYGQSLGGAVAARLVADNQQQGDVVGLVLENTFLSMRKLIPSVLPPARFLALLCHQVWPTDAVIPTITKVPILFLSGLKDEIVPPAHMRQLYDLSAAPNKIWKPLPLGDHNSSVLEDGYFEAIADFIASATDEGPLEKPL